MISRPMQTYIQSVNLKKKKNLCYNGVNGELKLIDKDSMRAMVESGRNF